MNKVFICYWDADTYGSDILLKTDISYFTETNGYDNADIRIINDLGVSFSYKLDGHLITRYK